MKILQNFVAFSEYMYELYPPPLKFVSNTRRLLIELLTHNLRQRIMYIFMQAFFPLESTFVLNLKQALELFSKGRDYGKKPPL